MAYLKSWEMAFRYRNARCTHQDQSQACAGYRNGRSTLQDQLNADSADHIQQTSHYPPLRLFPLLVVTDLITPPSSSRLPASSFPVLPTK